MMQPRRAFHGAKFTQCAASILLALAAVLLAAQSAEAQRYPPIGGGGSSGVNPNSQLDCQVHLPILSFLGQDDLCSSWIQVQNVGCEYNKAALVAWGEPGFCPPQSAGPLKVECSGLLRPGSTWNFFGAQVPGGAKSGIVFKFSARQLHDIGVDLGFDDVVADYMCESLFFGVVGDADDYRRFKKAYNEGLTFAGVPMDRARGKGFLAVDVLRTCPGDLTPGVPVTSKYNGIAGSHLGTFDPVFGGFGYYVPLVYADKAGFNTIIYVQNGGLECSSLEIWFKAQDDCLRARICDVATLAPGETIQLDASDCVGPGFQGNAWVRSSEPMGIAVDVIGRDLLMTYIGEPSEINYTYDPGSAYSTPGNQVAFGPLTYSEYQGWDTGIQVQNLSAVTAAKVKVYFLDRSGGVIATVVDWICPRGSQTFFLPVIFDLPGVWVGSTRVESQEWITPGAPRVAPPNIVGVVSLIKYSDAARTDATEAIAYNLLPEHKVFDWQIAPGTRGGLESGIGLIAIPSLLKDRRSTGVTSELAITNVVPKPGFTDFVIYFYDQNGLLDYVCEKLNEKQVEYIDLAKWGYINSGYKGSAIISAVFWEHDVFDPAGRFERNLVGLSALSIERSGATLGEDVPGDEAAGARGIPFSLAQVHGERCPFTFAFAFPPACPGVPIARGDPYSCPDTYSVSCTDCPVIIPEGGNVLTRVNVAVPANCRVSDIDVRLDIQHMNDGDIALSLAHGKIPPSALNFKPLFANICGASDNIQAVLDDDAPSAIGSVCPPAGFFRYRSQGGTLEDFEGEFGLGEWILRAADTANVGASGRILDYTLEFELQSVFAP